jgi:predicted NAD/FAD-dependent oxidoreductase
MGEIRNVAVIGAGLAGIAAARVLAGAGIAVTIYDKGSKPGGRLATRKSQGFTFNHGCQFFIPRDAGFLAAVKSFSELWPQAGEGRYAGVPEMAALAEELVPEPAKLVHFQGTHVSFLKRHGARWRLSLQVAATVAPGFVARGGMISEPFDAMVLAIPAPQAKGLLEAAGHDFAPALGGVEIAPCWALMLGFDADVAGPAVVEDGGEISWIARENSRPGSAAMPVAYTVHAAPGWSVAHLEDTPEAVAATLVAEFAALTEIHAKPAYVKAHRWRFARASKPLGEPFLWDAAQRLGLCGDWCLGGRLEAAWLSGRALGIRLAHDP